MSNQDFGIYGPFSAMIAATDIAINAVTANKATTENTPEPASCARSFDKAFAIIDSLLVRAIFTRSRTATVG